MRLFSLILLACGVLALVHFALGNSDAAKVLFGIAFVGACVLIAIRGAFWVALIAMALCFHFLDPKNFPLW